MIVIIYHQSVIFDPFCRIVKNRRAHQNTTNLFIFQFVSDDFLLFEKMDQRNCIKFCIKNKIKCARTFEMLTALIRHQL